MAAKAFSLFSQLSRARVRSLAHRLASVDVPRLGLIPTELQGEVFKPAAVAIVLCPDGLGRASFVLTKRSSTLRKHSGQWALPGGRIDAGETEYEAALRELQEELGLNIEQSDVLGRLDPFYSRSGYCITPVLCWFDEVPQFRPNPGEVESAHLVPLSDFDLPDVPALGSIPESDRPVLSLPLMGQRIHAPTAAILYQLFELVVNSSLVRVAHFEQPVFAWR